MDDIFEKLQISLPVLANLSVLKEERPIAPAHQPFLVAVEPVKPGKSEPPGSTPTAYRYSVVLPGSGFFRLDIKVKETAPSITQAEIEAAETPFKVNIEGFYLGTFSVEGGGRKAYVKADKVTPIRSGNASFASPKKEAP